MNEPNTPLHPGAAAAAPIPYEEKILPAYRKAAENAEFLSFTCDEEAARAPGPDWETLKEQEKITAPVGSTFPAVDLYVYRPQNGGAERLPVVYYIHGGGFLMRRALANRPRYQSLADNLGAAVVTPKYRIATEAPFPAALDDARKGLRYVVETAAALGLDGSRVILMGDSAGGGIAAALALYNRDHDGIPLLGQVLIYPMLDCRTGSSESLYDAPHTGHVCWDAPNNAYAWSKLRGETPIPAAMMPYFSPSLAENLRDLPSALIYAGGLDLFVLEDLAYAGKLIEAGNDTTVYVVPGLFHAFEKQYPDGAESREFWQRIYAAVFSMLKSRPER